MLQVAIQIWSGHIPKPPHNASCLPNQLDSVNISTILEVGLRVKNVYEFTYLGMYTWHF